MSSIWVLPEHSKRCQCAKKREGEVVKCLGGMNNLYYQIRIPSSTLGHDSVPNTRTYGLPYSLSVNTLEFSHSFHAQTSTLAC
jgi:hypothetical protein